MEEEAPTTARPVDQARADQELVASIKKATNPEESAPKQKHVQKCIAHARDSASSMFFWMTLKAQPILADEVQIFKTLIIVHKLLQEGGPVVMEEAQGQTRWLESCVGSASQRGYGPLILLYVQFILAKLQFHRMHRDLNGLFEYDEQVTCLLDPNDGFEAISDLMDLQDQIESFQSIVFANLHDYTSAKCRIFALAPFVLESWGIYRFVTFILRRMHEVTDLMDALAPLRDRYHSQHRRLQQFYYECLNLRFLTELTKVPKLAQEPPSLTESNDASDLPARPITATPPIEPTASVAEIEEQHRMLREYAEQQEALRATREAEERERLEMQARQQQELEEQRRAQAESVRLAQEQLLQQVMTQVHDAAAQQQSQLEQQLLSLRGENERDQSLLEKHDQRMKALERELAEFINIREIEQLEEELRMQAERNQLLFERYNRRVKFIEREFTKATRSKDDRIAHLQEELTSWRNKYEAIARIYKKTRSEHLGVLSELKQMRLKVDSFQETEDRTERMESDLRAKDLELAEMIRQRDEAQSDVKEQKGLYEEELDRLRQDLDSAKDREQAVFQSTTEHEPSLHAKQTHIDDLLAQLNDARLEQERMTQEKDTEIAILQQGLDLMINGLAE